MNLGEQWYLLRAQDDQLRSDLSKAEGTVQGSAARSGTAAGKAIGSGMATGAKAGTDQIVAGQGAATTKVGGLWGNLTGQLKQNWNGVALAAGGIGAAFAATQVIGFLGDAVTAASDLNETVAKSGEIFGQEAIPGLEKWAETGAQAFGQSKQQALDGAATFGVFGRSAGLAGKDLAGFSTEMVELASDMASFSNTSPEEAILAIGSALRGEAEPIRAYGVLLDDATLRQRAFEMGLIRTTKEALTPQQKVLAAQAEILAQTSIQQGDFARTSEGLANQQRILNAEWENAQAQLGQALLPVMQLVVGFVRDHIIPAFQDFGELLTNISDIVASVSSIWAKETLDMALNFGDMGDRVHAAADRTGVDFQTMKDAVREHMLATGQTVEQATAAIERELLGTEERLVASGAAWESYTNQTAAGVQAATDVVASGMPEIARLLGDDDGTIAAALDTTMGQMPLATQHAVEEMLAQAKLGPSGVSVVLRDGTEVVGKDAADLAAKLPDAMAAEKERAIDEMRQTLSGMVEVLSEDEVEKVVQEQTDAVAAEWSDAARQMALYAFLASADVRNGLASEDTGLRQDTIDRVNTVLEQLGVLVPAGETIGENVPTHLRDGFNRNMGLVETATKDAAAKAGYNLDFRTAADAQGYGGVVKYADGQRRAGTLAVSAAYAVKVQATRSLDAGTAPTTHGSNVSSRFGGGIASQYYAVQTKARNVAAAATSPLAAAGNSAYSWGSRLSANFNAGMASYYAAIKATSLSLGAAASVGLQLRSPAKEGALSDPGVDGGWGAKLVEMFGGGMRRAIPILREASLAAAAAAKLDPAVTVPTLSSASAARYVGLANAAGASAGHAGGGLSIGAIHLHLPSGWRGTDGEIRDISQRLAQEIRLRTA